MRILRAVSTGDKYCVKTWVDCYRMCKCKLETKYRHTRWNNQSKEVYHPLDSVVQWLFEVMSPQTEERASIKKEQNIQPAFYLVLIHDKLQDIRRNSCFSMPLLIAWWEDVVVSVDLEDKRFWVILRCHGSSFKSLKPWLYLLSHLFWYGQWRYESNAIRPPTSSVLKTSI